MSAVESKLKLTKILGLGRYMVAFDGALLPLSLSLIILVSGCSWFADKRIRIEPKIDITSPKYKKMLSMIIGNRYDSEYLRTIAADQAHQEYLLSRKRPTADMKKFIDKLDIIIQKAQESLSVRSVELAYQEHLLTKK